MPRQLSKADQTPEAKPVRATVSCGRQGEIAAQNYLEARGFCIVDVNVRMGKSRGLLGELDIIAWDGPVLCFVEVKTRKGRPGFVAPAEAVTPAKQKQIARLAVAYANENGFLSDENERENGGFALRFDVVSVVLSPVSAENEAGFAVRRIELIRGAFFAPPDFADE